MWFVFQPNGNIYPVLNDIIGPNCYDLASLVHGGQIDGREESVLIQELQYVLENIIYHITEIMVNILTMHTCIITWSFVMVIMSLA